MSRIVLNVARLGRSPPLAIVAISYQFATPPQRGADVQPGELLQLLHDPDEPVRDRDARARRDRPAAPSERLVRRGSRGGQRCTSRSPASCSRVLLAGLQESLDTHIAWVDFTVHKLMPVVLVADWLIDPPRHRLPFRHRPRLAALSPRVPGLHADPRCRGRLVPVPVPRCRRSTATAGCSSTAR